MLHHSANSNVLFQHYLDKPKINTVASMLNIDESSQNQEEKTISRSHLPRLTTPIYMTKERKHEIKKNDPIIIQMTTEVKQIESQLNPTKATRWRQQVNITITFFNRSIY